MKIAKSIIWGNNSWGVVGDKYILGNVGEILPACPPPVTRGNPKCIDWEQELQR